MQSICKSRTLETWLYFQINCDSQHSSHSHLQTQLAIWVYKFEHHRGIVLFCVIPSKEEEEEDKLGF